MTITTNAIRHANPTDSQSCEIQRGFITTRRTEVKFTREFVVFLTTIRGPYGTAFKQTGIREALVIQGSTAVRLSKRPSAKRREAAFGAPRRRLSERDRACPRSPP